MDTKRDFAVFASKIKLLLAQVKRKRATIRNRPITEIKQVAQLSLTNPRDALHHDKRQNFKTLA